MGSALPLTIVALALLYLPYRISRGFSPAARVLIVMIVAVKAMLITVIHLSYVNSTGHPIVLDESIDAKRYYDFGAAFANFDIAEITHDDLTKERGASAHLGYYVANLIAAKACPDHPMLFLRLAKLLSFHIGLGMLATTWRITATPTRAIVAYVVLGALFYQFTYYGFRNLKDDLILAIFMVIMAIADRTVSTTHRREALSLKKMVGSWIAIAAMLWLLSTLRFYLALAIVCAFGVHTVTGRGLKASHRALFACVLVIGFLGFAGTTGMDMAREHGGAGAVAGSAGNVYGLFKIFVRPLPWQHVTPMMGIPHTLYLFLLPPALWALLVRLRDNLNWKLYLVGALALILGAFMEDYEPRKRYVMYPIFVSWIVLAGRRKEEADSSEEAPFDPDAYFADPRNVYT